MSNKHHSNKNNREREDKGPQLDPKPSQELLNIITNSV